MLNGLIGKGALVANKYQDLQLTGADPGYPLQTTIKLINTNPVACIVSVYLTQQNATSPSNGDSVYNQYTINANESLLIETIAMSSDEGILLLSSASNVNYYVTGVQSPA